MHKVDIQVDTREAAALERRRIAEKQRQSRIFNARERIIGVCPAPTATAGISVSSLCCDLSTG